jgi:hypothetical protein
MFENCQVCNVRFEVEPGFFYGSMFISYGFSIVIMLLGGCIIYYTFNDPSSMYYVVPITTISLILVPINFRISRILFLYLFSGLKFESNAKQESGDFIA